MNIKKFLSFSLIELIIIGILETIIGPLIPVLSESLSISFSLIGLIISIHTLGLVITSIITGNLIQLFGHKKILIWGMILSSLGCLGLFVSYNYYVFLFSYLILGIGTGAVSTSTNSLICDLYCHKRSNALLTLNTGWLIGVFTAPLLVSFILWIKYSWRNLFLFILIIQIIIFFYILNQKFKIISKKENIRLFSVINKNIFSDFHFIFSCIIVFLYAAITRTFSFWFTTYFLTLNINVETSSIFLAFYSTSSIAGMFLKKFLLKYFNEKQILLYNSIISLISLLLSVIVNIVILKIIFTFIFGMNIIGFITIAISLGTKSNPRYSGPITGLINGANNLGVVIFQYIVGYFSCHFSKSSVLYIDLILLFALCITTFIFNLFSKLVGTKAP